MTTVSIRRSGSLAAAGALALAAQPGRAAAHTDVATLPQQPPWTIVLRPSLWRPGLGGDVDTNARRLDVRRFDLDDPDIGFTGEAELRTAHVVLRLGGFHFDTTGSGEASSTLTLDKAVAPPDARFRAEADITSGQLTIGRQFTWTIGRDAHHRSVDLSLEVYAGARAYDATVSLDPAGGPGDETGGFFLEPLAGARLTLDVLQRGSVRFSADAGAQPFGSRTSASFDLQAVFALSPAPNTEIFVGWRQIVMDLERSDDTLDISLAGLFFGATLSF